MQGNRTSWGPEPPFPTRSAATLMPRPLGTRFPAGRQSFSYLISKLLDLLAPRKKKGGTPRAEAARKGMDRE